MDLKNLLTHFTYRIEPKPEGGFIAHSSNPNVPPLEAPTRQELQQKIQANIATALAAQFPGLKLPLQNQPLNVSFHIEHKPDGTFDIHSGDPASASIQGVSGDEIEPFRGEDSQPGRKTSLAGILASAGCATGLRKRQGIRQQDESECESQGG